MGEVSAVITTVNRPKVLVRAINSVLNQTYKDIEIIVVVDGAAEETIKWIERKYPEIIIVAPKKNVGGSEARNLGISASTKEYIALLDDDDEWLPNKIETQLNTVKIITNQNVCCFSSVYTYRSNPEKMFVFSKNKLAQEKISDYIFGTSFGFRTGGFQTSTIFAPKAVFEKNPFIKNLPKHQDWTWALDADKKEIKFIKITTPLSIYHKDANANGISKQYIWEFSKKWVDDRKSEMSDISYNNFLLFVVQNGISKDKTRGKIARLKLINEVNKGIPLLYKFTLISIRYRLQCLLQILKGVQ